MKTTQHLINSKKFLTNLTKIIGMDEVTQDLRGFLPVYVTTQVSDINLNTLFRNRRFMLDKMT